MTECSLSTPHDDVATLSGPFPRGRTLSELKSADGTAVTHRANRRNRKDEKIDFEVFGPGQYLYFDIGRLIQVENITGKSAGDIIRNQG